MSKLNLWNFLNFKKFRDKSLSLLFFIKGLKFPTLKSIDIILSDPVVERRVAFTLFTLSALLALYCYLGY